ncbi:hypothetical protein ACUJ8H_43165 [Streptomyces sp. EKR5.2]|uniref:hypothetical protein n=1 Tax=Streptomyces sp. EKR5.2 TaxID=3461014 RepID=UPI00404119C9
MTTLYLSGRDIAALSSGPDGAMAVELTEDGERSLVAAAARLVAVASVPPAQRRAAWLKELSNEDLVDLAMGRLGAPDQDVMTEVVRRMKDMLEQLSPVLSAIRTAGIVPASEGAS